MDGLIDRTRVPLAAPADRDLGEAPRAALPSWVRLNFAVQHQLQDQWCWAAVSTSIAVHYGSSRWTQCSVVNSELGQSTCCEDGSAGACNQPWYLDRALKRVGALGKVEKGKPKNLDKVRKEIDGRRPVGIRIGWSGGGGHFVTIEGYRSDSGTIAIEDPWYGASDVPFGAMAGSYQGSGSWTHTYFTRKP
jgi:papain like cysteine protease AvrRpt2